MIKKYSLFLEGLFTKKQEVPYYFSERLRDVFIRMYGMDIPMSGLLLSNENRYMVRDDITYIDITDKDDTISFIQVNRLLRMKEDEEMELEVWTSGLWIGTKSTLDSKVWKEQRTEMGIGRFFTRFYQKSEEPINDKTKEVLVNAYKSSYKSIKNSDTRFELVKGEDIRKWYLEDRYEMNKGQLSSSCMRYSRCQPYLDIYVKNPEVCSLLILHGNDPEKIVGRALLWKLSKPEGGTYLDRIYTHLDSDKNLFIDWAKKNDIKATHARGLSSYGYDVEVQLGDQSYKQFPYMDTFRCYNNTTHILSSNEDHLEDESWWDLQDTQGGYTEGGRVWSEYSQDYIDRDDAVYCSGEWFRRDDARWVESRGIWVSPDNDDYVWCEYADQYYHTDDCVYSDLNDSYILTEDAQSVWVDNNSEEYILKDDVVKLTKEVEMDGETKLCISRNIIFNPFTNTWLFKGDRLDVYYCDELRLSLTEEDAKIKGVEIDESRRTTVKGRDYVNSLIKIDDVDPDKLLNYLKEVKMTDGVRTKMNDLLGDQYIQYRLHQLRVDDETIFKMVKLGIWFLPPDSERRTDLVIRHNLSFSGNLISKEAKEFLDETTIGIIENQIFDVIVKKISDMMVYDVITDPEMLKTFIKIKSI